MKKNFNFNFSGEQRVINDDNDLSAIKPTLDTSGLSQEVSFDLQLLKQNTTNQGLQQIDEENES
jgi:hypothetical protein